MKALDEQQVVLDYQNNMPIDDMLNKYQVEESVIRRILKSAKADRKITRFSDELVQRIVTLRLAGCSIGKIKKTLLISERGVLNTLKKCQIPTPPFTDTNMRYGRNRYYFDQIDTSNKAYVLGLLFADGYNHRKYNNITLSLQDVDAELIYRIKDEIEYEGPLVFRNYHDKNPRYHNQVALSITDEHMSQQLESLGMVQAKSLILTFPEFLDDSLLPHFIRGYFDGDGSLSLCPRKKGNYVSSTLTITSSTIFCQRLQAIIASMDIYCRLVCPPRCKPETSILTMSGVSNTYCFLSWLYANADLKMERKYQKYLQLCSLLGKSCEIPSRCSELAR